jgi:oligoendopeptidase F
MADKINYSNLDRTKIPERYKWNVNDIYENDAEWKKEKARLYKEFDVLEKSYKGKVGNSAKMLYEALNKIHEVSRCVGKFKDYAKLLSDQDKSNAKALSMKEEGHKVHTDFLTVISFLKPEVINIDSKTLKKYFSDYEPLTIYKQYLDDITRQRSHILSKEQEIILSESELISSAPYNIYSTLYNTEIQFPKVTLSDGSVIEMSIPTYTKHRSSNNRKDRIAIFDGFWSTFDKMKGTFATMLNEQLKNDYFYAKIRNYKSTLSASLDGFNIPEQVYRVLLKSINKNLGSLHRYLKLRKKILGLDEMHYYDLYCPLVDSVKTSYKWEEVHPLLIESLDPLGNDYVDILKVGLKNRWADVYPNKGKRSGAYSDGDIYDLHPYILLNYTDDFDSLSTTAHEFGHAIHSYLSNKNQPYVYADYSIFLAEIASTVNEYLLSAYLINKTNDKKLKMYLIGEMLDRIRTTIFRQALFAEFELKIHEVIESGGSVNADLLGKIYGELLQRYYGHDKDIVLIDDYLHIEWTFIPHFYYNYYVYNYVTGLISAMTLGEGILTDGQETIDKYLKMLKSGCSKYPIELLKDAGVDFMTEKPIDDAMKSFNKYLDMMEDLM